MSDFLGPLILVTFCSVVSYWEHSRYGTAVTPFGVMVWPYATIVIMINFGGQFFGFFPVSLKSIMFVVLCLFAFLGGEKLAEVMSGARREEINKVSQPDNIGSLLEYYRPLFITFAVVSIVAGLIHFRQTVNEYGWAGIASTEFRSDYGTGFLSHIQNLSRPAFFFLFADYLLNRKKQVLLLLILIFLMVVARQVKYHAIVLLLGGVYLSYLYGLIRFTFKKLLFYSLIIYFVFNLAYVIGFSTLGLSHAYSTKVQGFLFNHFFTYLFGGPIAFSQIMDSAAFPVYSWQEILVVPLNLAKKIQGDPYLIDIIIRNWVNVSNITKYSHSANVYSFYGMVWFYVGYLGTIAYTVLVGMISYLVFWSARRKNAGIAAQLMLVLIMSFLTLSFFGFYFNMVNFWEVTFFILVIPPVYVLIRRLAHFTLTLHRDESLGNEEDHSRVHLS